MSSSRAELIFKLRLVVGRVGEMDLARWWNTNGQLGAMGASVLRRGFPRTHRFAQARSVFAVAAQRCRDLYRPAGSAVTLWALPAEIEDELEQAWESWLDHAEDWEPFFTSLETCTTDVASELARVGLIEPAHVDAAAALRRSAENRAVLLPGEFVGSEDDFRLLALGFARAEPGSPAVPYQRWSGEL